jgi:hypothetical protein
VWSAVQTGHCGQLYEQLIGIIRWSAAGPVIWRIKEKIM